MRSDLVAQALDGENGVDSVLARDEVFGLQFFAGAGREAHAEVRQAFVPRAGHAHLFGAILGGELDDRVKIFRRAHSRRRIRAAASNACRARCGVLSQTSLRRFFCQSVNRLTL